MGIEWIILYFGLSALAGIVAARKARSGIGFFLLALALSPILGLLAAALARPAEAREHALVRAGYRSKTWRKCSSCAEIVRREAQVCRFCGLSLTPELEKQPPRELTLREILQAEQARGDGERPPPAA